MRIHTSSHPYIILAQQCRSKFCLLLMPFGHTFQLQFAELDVATVETRNQDLNSNSAQNDLIFEETDAAFNVLRRLEGSFVSGRQMGSRW